MALQIIGVGLGAIVAGGASLLSFGPGIGDFFTRTLNQTFQQRLASAADLLSAYRKGEITQTQFQDWMHENGFNDRQTDVLLTSTSTPINISEIITLWFRYKDSPGNSFQVNKKWLRERMQAIAVDPKREAELIEANRPVPSLDDIIRFAIRDVYEPEAVALGRLDENLPPLFLQEAGKRGLVKEDAINIWRAHWMFPSIHQMFEMFHRLFDHPNPNIRFGRREMDVAFNVADIAPGMRDRLQAIAYTPIGRVDIRRFDRLGVYGEGEERKKNLKRAYMELGYSPEDAELQTEFTIGLVDRQSAVFTRAQVLKNYNEGFPKENTKKFAQQQLTRLGLKESEIETVLQLEDEKRISIDTQVSLDKIKEDYVEGRIKNESQLRDQLGGIPLSTGQRSKAFEEITREKDRETKRPSPTQADALFQAKIINEREWRELYAYNGYSKIDQDWLFELVQRETSNLQRLPSKDDLLGWLGQGIIEPPLFASTMRELGYAKKWIDLYLLSAGIGE